jgi:GT2 family glycosyltransferase
MVARLSEGDCDGVGNTLILSSGRVQSYGGVWQSWLGRAVSIGIGESSEKRIDRAEIEKRQNYLNGASMMVNRRFLNRTGMMREDYFLYCEEVEWCLRAVRQGIRLGFAEDAAVLHHVGTTTGRNRDAGSSMSPSIYLGNRNVILMTKDCFPARVLFVALSLGLLISLRFIRRDTWRQLENAYSGWTAGLRGERGRPKWMT